MPPTWNENIDLSAVYYTPLYSLTTDFGTMLTDARAVAESHIASNPLVMGPGPAPIPVLSPGYLGLLYQDAVGNQHRTRFRLLRGQDPTDYTSMLAEANRLAPFLAGVMTVDQAVSGFFTEDFDGHRLIDSLLSANYPGTHNAGTTFTQMWSFTICLTGRTAIVDPDYLPGEELSRWFPYKYELPPRGAKAHPVSTDLTILNYAAALATSTVCWGDYAGYKASIRPNAPIQSNAAIQRRKGW